MKITMNNCNGEIDINKLLRGVVDSILDNIKGDSFKLEQSEVEEFKFAKGCFDKFDEEQKQPIFQTGVINENDSPKYQELRAITSIEDSANFIANEVSYIANKNHHYDNNPQLSQLLMHVVSELTEASQAALKNKFATAEQLRHINSEDAFDIEYFEQNIKNTTGDEMADVVILLLSIAKYMKIDIAKHIALKMCYNKLRTKHSVETNSYSAVSSTTTSSKPSKFI